MTDRRVRCEAVGIVEASEPDDSSTEVRVAAFSGNGRRLLTTREVGTASVVDLRTNHVVGVIRPESAVAASRDAFKVYVESAALDTTGELALLGLNDGTAGLFRVADGRRLHKFIPEDDRSLSMRSVVRAVAFSATGDLIAIGFRAGRVGVWRTRDGALLARLGPSRCPSPGRWDGREGGLVCSVSFSSDGNHVFGGCHGGFAALWELADGEIIRDAVDQTETVRAILVRGEEYAFATDGGTLWAGRRGAPPERRFMAQQNWEEAVFSPEGNQVLVRTKEGDIGLWSRDGESRILATWAGSPSGLSCLDSGTLFHAGAVVVHPIRDDSVAFHDLRSGSTTAVSGKSQTISIAGPRGLIAIRTTWEHVDVWRVSPTSRLMRLHVGTTPDRMAFSPDGSRLAVTARTVGSDDPGVLQIWDVERGVKLRSRRLEGAEPQSIVWFSGGGSLATTSWHGPLEIWTVEGSDFPPPKKVMLQETRRFPRSLVGAGAGDRLVIGSLDHVGILDPRSDQPRWIKAPGIVGLFASMSHDGRFLYYSGRSHAIYEFDVESGGTTSLCPEPIEHAECIELRPDPDATERVWTAPLWPWPGGPYVHQTMTSSGEFESITPSPDRCRMVARRPGWMAVVTTDEPRAILAKRPFPGSMRASCVTEREALAVNERGEVFRLSF